MAGRNDFGILRAAFMADTRAHTAAGLFVDRGLAVETTGLATVSGVVVQLGLWAMRETDDGVLPGDGVAAAQVATLLPRAACKAALDALGDAGLVRPKSGGIYLVGFRDCYEPILDTRETNRLKARAKRAKSRAKLARDTVPGDVPGDVPAPGEGTSPPLSRTTVPAVPFRALPAEPNPPAVAGDGAALAADDRAVFETIWRKREKMLNRDHDEAARLRATLATTRPDVEGIVAFIERLTPTFAKDVQNSRRTSRMAANGRKEAAKARQPQVGLDGQEAAQS